MVSSFWAGESPCEATPYTRSGIARKLPGAPGTAIYEGKRAK
jgi:hypothetical protein